MMIQGDYRRILFDETVYFLAVCGANFVDFLSDKGKRAEAIFRGEFVKGLSDAQLGNLAKVPQVDTEKNAITKIQGTDAVSIASAELEAEHRCLIWSFDLRVAGHSGIQEVQVDAGDGKVLSVKHETASQEATEASKEKATLPRK
jgi:hypothetical protein